MLKYDSPIEVTEEFDIFPGTRVLKKGQTLKLGSALLSLDGRFALEMQSDGNLVLYGPRRQVGWASGTSGKKIR